MYAFRDLINKKFGKLTAIKIIGKKSSFNLWECLCDCGKITNKTSRDLISGNVKSCGCIKSPNEKEYFDRLKSRLLSKSKKNGECIEWQGTKDKKGYGITGICNKSLNIEKHTSTHRISWMVWKGGIPEEMCVLHKCDNPSCFNPEHLFLGNRKDNSDDMIKKGRQHHLKGEDQPNSILTEEQVLKIRKLYKRWVYTVKILAKEFGVSETCIKEVIRGNSWKHLL